MDRLEITISGDLPDERKFHILAAAESEVQEWVRSFQERHKVSLNAGVKPVRPGKKKVAPTLPEAAK